MTGLLSRLPGRTRASLSRFIESQNLPHWLLRLFKGQSTSYAVGGKRHTVATWFGSCSYRRLKVTPEVRKKLCPICESELVRIQYSGSKRLYLSEEDDTFEDFLEDGVAVWSEAPLKRRKRWSGAKQFTPSDFATPITQDKIDELFSSYVKYGSRGKLVASGGE